MEQEAGDKIKREIQEYILTSIDVQDVDLKCIYSILTSIIKKVYAIHSYMLYFSFEPASSSGMLKGWNTAHLRDDVAIMGASRVQPEDGLAWDSWINNWKSNIKNTVSKIWVKTKIQMHSEKQFFKTWVCFSDTWKKTNINKRHKMMVDLIGK